MMCTSTGWRVETKPFTIMRASRSLRCTASSFLRIFVRLVILAGDQLAVQTGQPISPELLCHIHGGGPRRIAHAMPNVLQVAANWPVISPTSLAALDPSDALSTFAAEPYRAAPHRSRRCSLSRAHAFSSR